MWPAEVILCACVAAVCARAPPGSPSGGASSSSDGTSGGSTSGGGSVHEVSLNVDGEALPLAFASTDDLYVVALRTVARHGLRHATCEVGVTTAGGGVPGRSSGVDACVARYLAAEMESKVRVRCHGVAAGDRWNTCDDAAVAGSPPHPRLVPSVRVRIRGASPHIHPFIACCRSHILARTRAHTHVRARTFSAWRRRSRSTWRAQRRGALGCSACGATTARAGHGPSPGSLW